MISSQASFPHISSARIALAAILAFMPLMQGQLVTGGSGEASGLAAAVRPGVGVPYDWTHRHLIFSRPGAAEGALQNGTYDRWLKITNDPRYAMQQRRRGGIPPDLRTASQMLSTETGFVHNPKTVTENENAVEAASPLFPEEPPDGVLPRGIVRALIPPRSPQTGIRRELPRMTFKRHTWKKTNSLQKDWSETLGSSGTTGLGNFPATFTQTFASCTSDFAVYNTSLAGSSSQASVVAFNHLYSSCTSRPSVYWAYDTGGTILNSVALSMDGTQVAFVQTDNSTGRADFVVLKWTASSGTLTSPTVLGSNSSFPNCTAPCMISIPFSGSPTDKYSSPFIDYGSGTAYVGDDAGAIHKFTKVFSASAPAETTSTWPVTLNISTDAALASPVYDSVSDKIFVGDYLANPASNCQPGVQSTEGQCGYLYSVDASSGVVTQSAQLDFNLGIHDSPIVDSSAGMVYTFVGADNSTNCSSGPCAAVFQFPVVFSGGATGTEATVGAGYQFLMSGTFDNQYFTSSGSPSGHLYVVGGTGPQNNTLYAIAIDNNAMTSGGALAGPPVADNYTNGYYATGLQVTEFCNNGASACTATQGTDYLFLSVLSYGSQFSTNPCPGQSLTNGCIIGFTVPASGAISSAATPNGTLQEAGGTGGIVVDNGVAGASNIYFSTLLNQTCTTSGGTGGCAVSATQAGLQ
jgi:hypothetical protein